MRLIDADALLEAVKKACLYPLLDDSDWKDVFMRGNDISTLITNAPTVQREGWVSVPTDEMVKVLMVELQKINYLSHPDVPYEGTASGDSPDDWHRRVIKYVLTKTLSSAPKE